MPAFDPARPDRTGYQADWNTLQATITALTARIAGLERSLAQTVSPIGPTQAPASVNVSTASGVSMVSLAMPSIMTVAGSPSSSVANLAVSLATQAVNTVFAGPATGAADIPAFRSLVAADIPTIAHSSLSGLTTGDGHTQYIALANATALRNTIQPSADVVALTIKPKSGGSANSQEWYNASNTRVLYVSAVGNIQMNTAGPSVSFLINNNASSGYDFSCTGGSIRIYGENGIVLRKKTEVGTSGEIAANVIPFLVQGAASQTATLVQLKGLSSTSTSREMVDFDAVWVTSTDASRKSRGLVYAWDTVRREAIRWESDGARANMGLLGGGSFGSGSGVIFIANATTVPSTNPAGGGILYVDAGALKYIGSGGTVTTIGPA